jgi:hypothetical protein
VGAFLLRDSAEVGLAPQPTPASRGPGPAVVVAITSE